MPKPKSKEQRKKLSKNRIKKFAPQKANYIQKWKKKIKIRDHLVLQLISVRSKNEIILTG
jgi:hypothetical protein